MGITWQYTASYVQPQKLRFLDIPFSNHYNTKKAIFFEKVLRMRILRVLFCRSKDTTASVMIPGRKSVFCQDRINTDVFIL
jgi:hypothetical protein